jgi:hypothetical protein
VMTFWTTIAHDGSDSKLAHRNCIPKEKSEIV